MIPLDGLSTVEGSFDFDDPDGDLDRLAIEITTPSGVSSQLPQSVLQGVLGIVSGTINWSMFLDPPEEGLYEFDIWVIDDADNESNRLAGGFTVGLNCDTTTRGCECSSTASDMLDECSESSVGGVCCRSEITGVCSCEEQVCIQDTVLGDCVCANRNYAETANGVEVASCTGGGDIHCCLADDAITFGGVCECRDIGCLDGIETEVATCDVSMVKDCGRDTNVDSCR